MMNHPTPQIGILQVQAPHAVGTLVFAKLPGLGAKRCAMDGKLWTIDAIWTEDGERWCTARPSVGRGQHNSAEYRIVTPRDEMKKRVRQIFS